MNFILPKLNFQSKKLSDLMSEETIRYHYEKHHQTYITNLNTLIKNTELERLTIDEIVFKSSGGIFNNAAQTWNHTFYWKSITDNASSLSDCPNLSKAITTQYGSIDKFQSAFIDSAKSLFGSGWTWLVRGSGNKLTFVNKSNANNVSGDGLTPLMVCDVWEHAYYIDFRNERVKYLTAFWNHIDWNFVEKNFNNKETLLLNNFLT
jgi:Fe-Mn family superoxide dismutase